LFRAELFRAGPPATAAVQGGDVLDTVRGAFADILGRPDVRRTLTSSH